MAEIPLLKLLRRELRRIPKAQERGRTRFGLLTGRPTHGISAVAHLGPKDQSLRQRACGLINIQNVCRSRLFSQIRHTVHADGELVPNNGVTACGPAGVQDAVGAT
jgi:uncharacterized heparinase superfamily protein